MTDEEVKLDRRATGADLDVSVEWMHPERDADADVADVRIYVVTSMRNDKVVRRTTSLEDVRDLVNGRLNYRPHLRPDTRCQVEGCSNLGQARGNERAELCAAHGSGRCWEPGCRDEGIVSFRKGRAGLHCAEHAVSVCRVGACMETPTPPSAAYQGRAWVCAFHIDHPGGGFRVERSGHVYVLQHSTWDAVKVGIANVAEPRLAQHRRAGWTVVWVSEKMPGAEALAAETSVLRGWREAGLERGAPEGSDGWTETASIWDVNPDELTASLDRTRVKERA